MLPFTLKVVTPYGEKFNGEIVSIKVRTVAGDVSIRARHADYFTALEASKVELRLPDDSIKTGACTAGCLTVKNGEASLVVDAFEFSDQIDLERAEKAKEIAEERIRDAKSKSEMALAKVKLKRALIRISVGENK